MGAILGGIILLLLGATMVWLFFKMGGIFAIIAGGVCIAVVICGIYVILKFVGVLD